MAQKYVENLLSSLLEEYVDRFDESSLEIGLWDGDVALSNLTIKQMQWSIGSGLSLSLEYGHIDKIQVQVPWMELRSGNVSAIIDTCHVVLRVQIDESLHKSDANHQSRISEAEHKANMAKLLQDELKLLSSSPDTWMSRAVDSFGSRLLTLIAGGSSLSVDHFKCSVLLPTSTKEYLHVQAQFEAVDVDPLKDPPNRGQLSPSQKLVIAKDLSIRGLTVTIASDLINLPASPLEYDALFDRFENTDIFLNPIHMLAHFWVHKKNDVKEQVDIGGADDIDDQPLDDIESKDDLTISFETHLSNFEITPNLGQLILLRDCSSHFYFMNLRSNMAHLHPSARSSPLSSSGIAEDAYFQLPGKVASYLAAADEGQGRVQGYPARHWWQYAIRAIISMNRARQVKAKESFGQSSGNKSEETPVLNQQYHVQHERPLLYMRLYQKFLQHKLSLLPSSHVIIGEGSRKAFTTVELAYMEHLHRSCRVSELLKYRSCVHKCLQRNGEKLTDLKLIIMDPDLSFVVTKNEDIYKALYPVAGKPVVKRMVLDAAGMSSHLRAMDAALMETWLECYGDRLEKVYLNAHVSLTRFAVVILQSSLTASASNALPAQDDTASAAADQGARAFTLALYGVNLEISKSSVQKSLKLNLNVGSLRSFGYENAELLSCGLEPNEWLQHFNAESESLRFQDYAIRFCFDSEQKYIFKDLAIVTNGAVRNISSTSHVEEKVKLTHKTLTLQIMPAAFSWDHLSMEFLKELGIAVRPLAPLLPAITESEFRKEFILRNHGVDLADDDIFKKRKSVLSLHLSLQGISLSMSNVNIFRGTESTASKASSTGTRRRASTKLNAGIKKFPPSAMPEESLVIKTGVITVVSGDFLSRWIEDDSEKAEGTESAEGVNFKSFMAAPWHQVNNSLRMLTRTFRHPLLYPMVFHFNDLEIFRTNRAQLDKQMKPKTLCKPWSFAGILSECIVPWHRDLTDMRLDVNFSPLNAAISQDDSIAVIDAVNGILDIFETDSESDAKLYPVIEPRISSLARNCQLHVNAAFGHANIAFIRETVDRYPREHFETLFYKFGYNIARRGLHSQIMITHRSILMSQLQASLAVVDAVSQAKHIVDMFVDSITVEKSESKEDSLDAAVKHAVDTIFDISAKTPSSRSNQSILDLRLTGLQFTFHKYTYDKRLTLKFTNFACFGGESKVPILRVHDDQYHLQQMLSAKNRTKHSEAATSVGTDPRMAFESKLKSPKKAPKGPHADAATAKDESAATIEQTLEAFEDHLARSALTLSYTEHDHGYSMAWGGLPTSHFLRHKRTILQHKFLQIPQSNHKRVGKLEINAQEIFANVHAEVVPEICTKISEASEVVGKHLNMLKMRKRNFRYMLNIELRNAGKTDANKAHTGVSNVDYFLDVKGGLTYNTDLSNYRKVQSRSFGRGVSDGDRVEQVISCPEAFLSELKLISTSDLQRIISHTGCRVKLNCSAVSNHIVLIGNIIQINKAKTLLSHVLVKGFQIRDRGTTSIKCNTHFDSIEVILAHESDIFAFAQLKRADLNITYSPVAASVYANGKFHTVSLYDLSEAGSLHPQVLWRSEVLNAEDAMIKFNLAIDVEIDPAEPQKQMLSVELNGARFSLLTRFVNELRIFLREKVRDRLRAAFAVKSAADQAEPARAESDSEESSPSTSDTESDEYDQLTANKTLRMKVNPTLRVATPVNRAFITPAGKDRPRQNSTFPAATAQEETVSEEKYADESWLRWDVRFVDIDFIIPRNSSSNDLVAFKVGFAVVNNDKVVTPLVAPTPIEALNDGRPIARSKHLNFNPDKNAWEFSTNEVQANDDSYELPLVSDASVDSSNDHISSFSPFSSGEDARDILSPVHSASPDLDFIARSASPNSRASKFVSLVQNIGKSGTEAGENSRVTDNLPRKESVEFEFFDALESKDTNASFQEMDSPHIRVVQPGPKKSYLDRKLLKKQEAYTTDRICVDLHGVTMFASLSGPMQSSSTSKVIIDIDETRKYLEIKADEPVYIANQRNKHITKVSAASQQTWRLLTQDSHGEVPFNMLIISDCQRDGEPNEVSKVLVGDNDVISPLSLQLTMSELYLLQSLWYDNLFEAPQSITPKVPFTVPPLFKNFPEYGTPDYFKFLLNSFIDTEFILVRSEICLDCFVDTEYFNQEMPSTRAQRLNHLWQLLAADPALASECIFHGMSTSNRENNNPISNTEQSPHWSNCSFPLSKIYIEGLVLHSTTRTKERKEDIGLVMALGAGVVEVLDTRLPRDLPEVAPRALRVSPLERGHEDAPGGLPRDLSSERVYGYADLQYGLDLTSYDISAEQDIPFKMLLSNTKHYMNINIGIDGTELNLKNLDFVNILVDYFALYHQHPGFGHPLRELLNTIPAEKLPYSCVDTRVFAIRPHVSLMQNPKVTTSPTLVLETDQGLYYRHMIDSNNSSKIELKIIDAVAVIHKIYCGPELSRGRRGSAGSGRGIRTQIEFLCLDFSVHYDGKANHTEIQIKIEPTFAVENSHVPKTNDRWKRIYDENRQNQQQRRDTERIRRSFPNLSQTQVVFKREDYQRTRTFTNYNSDYLFITPAEIRAPKTVYPLDESKGSKTDLSCNIVTSYEDILFTVAMVNDFLADPPVLSSDTAFTMSAYRALPAASAGSVSDATGFAAGEGEKRKEKKRKSSTGTSAPVTPKDNFLSSEKNIRISAAERERLNAANLIEKKKNASIFAVMDVDDLKCIVVDNVLGLHLPLASVTVKRVRVSASRQRKEKKRTMRRTTVIQGPDGKEKKVFRTADGFYSRDKWEEDLSFEVFFDKDNNPLFVTKMHSTVHIWADYFNNLKKCWEPLLEQMKANVIVDKGSGRGDGVVVRVESPIQINISGAFFRTLNDLIRMFQSAQAKHVNTSGQSVEKSVDAEISSGAGAVYADVAYNPGQIDNGASHLISKVPFSQSSHLSAPSTHVSHAESGAIGNAHKLGRQRISGYFQPGLADRMGGTFRSAAAGETGYRREKTDLSIYRFDYRSSFLRLQDSPSRAVDSRRRSGVNASVHEEGIRHVKYPPLEKGSRFGFSIMNSTGQQVRFLQQNESGKDMICYIDDGERGALNFVASTTRIRNNTIIREGFNVQMEYAGMEKKNAASATTRKMLAIQISGYAWLPQVHADELGVKFEDLHALNSFDQELVNDIKAKHSESHDWKVKNALKLVVEVTPLDGGRVLNLRSVFTIKNNTSHNISVFAHDEEQVGMPNKTDVLEEDDPFLLKINENFHVPLALLKRTSSKSRGKSLGFVKIKPADLVAVEKELGTRPDIQYGIEVGCTTNSIDLMETIVNTEAWFSALDKSRSQREDLQKLSMVQMGCTLKSRLRKPKRGSDDIESQGSATSVKSAGSLASKLPPFCYNIEIQRVVDNNVSHLQTTKTKSNFVQGLAGRLFRSKHHDIEAKYRVPVHYNLVIHPPIILENLLPMSGTFEILHADQNRVLWSSIIKPGKTVPIHTVTLEEPLRLRINLSYCRTVDPQVRIHTPINKSQSQRTFVDKLQRTVEEFLDDSPDEDSSVELTDTVGQRLRLGIENIEGGGGQRHVTIYCPYWIVNLSQYNVRIREEGAPRDQLPAGTVTPNKDGTASVAYGAQDMEEESHAAESASSSMFGRPIPRGNGTGTIFPGKNPLFHASRDPNRQNTHISLGRQIPRDSDLKDMLYGLEFDDLVDMAYMYNYPDNRITGKRRVLLQMDDSEWSEPISLDSVGTPFSVQVEHPDKGHVELGYKIKMAPGRLGKYTKIVRLMPRFVLENRVNVPLKFSQPAGFMGETEQWQDKAMVIRPQHLCPFHLSDMFTQRSLSVQYEGPYYRTVFFKVENIGMHTMKVDYKLDLATVPHVNTRDAPEYTVLFPADKDIGLFLETDWGENNIVVREFKPGAFAYTDTDMQIGDVIIAIDNESVNGKLFDRALSLLTNRTRTVEVRIRTAEENTRRVRLAAVAKVPEKNLKIAAAGSEQVPELDAATLSKVLRLEIQQYEASIFITVEEIVLDLKPEYRLMNATASHWIHYKQKGVSGNNWCSLRPGEVIAYTWENPFLPHKLLVKAGRNVLSRRWNSQEENNIVGVRSNVLTNGVDCLTGTAIDDHAAMTIALDEIGGKNLQLAMPDGSLGRLTADVTVAGSTKTLCIGPEPSMRLRELLYATMFLDKQRSMLDNYRNTLKNFYVSYFSRLISDDDEDIVEYHHNYDKILMRRMQEDKESVLEILDHMESGVASDRQLLVAESPLESVFGQHIHRLHQLEVEVIEAKELRPFVIGKMEDVYVSVQIHHEVPRSEMAKELIIGGLGLRERQKFSTYMCEKNMNPSFIGQKFLFDVPAEALDKKREFKICVKVMCDAVVQDKMLGQADIQFTSLVKEEELFGWFPLRSLKKNITSADGGIDITGSIKLRAQWVHSAKGLEQSIMKNVNLRLTEIEDQLRIQNQALLAHNGQSFRDKQMPAELLLQAQTRENDRLLAFSLMDDPGDGILFKESNDSSSVKIRTKPKRPSNALKTLADEWEWHAQQSNDASIGDIRRSRSVDDSFRPSIMDIPFSFTSQKVNDPINDDSDTFLMKTVKTRSVTMKPFTEADQQTPLKTPRRLSAPDASASLALGSTQRNPITDEKSSVTRRAHSNSFLSMQQLFLTESRKAICMARHKWDEIVKITLLEQNSSDQEVPLTKKTTSSAAPNDNTTPALNVLLGHPPMSLDPVQAVEKVMSRSETSISGANLFIKAFDDECDRSHKHVHTQGGRLEVTPIKALHLPGSMKKSMYVRITYGAEKKNTVSVKHAADLSWYHDGMAGDVYAEDMAEATPLNVHSGTDRDSEGYEDEDSPTKAFEVETLNIKSQLRVEVIDDSFFKKKVVAILTIPIFNLLDNLCGYEAEAEAAAAREASGQPAHSALDSIYNAWFPLTLSENAISSDGDSWNIRSWNTSVSEQFDYTKLPQGKPCIKIRFGWKKRIIDSSAVMSAMNVSKAYARLQLPYLSVAVVDSIKAREVMQWSIFSLEWRHFNTTKFTDNTLNVMWTQIDNQLPDQISPVLLAPTPMADPQPTVRLHIRKNNELSKDNLTSYDTIQVVIQTLDMRLEQQTVVATWALIKNWLHDTQESVPGRLGSSEGSPILRANTKNSYSAEKIETPIDQLGFASCYDTSVYDLLPTLGKSSSHSGHPREGSNQDAEKMVYISFINIGPIKINASFIMNPNLTGGGLTIHKRQTRASMSDDVDFKSSVMLFVSMVGDVALDITSSISDAPISLPFYKRNTIFETENEINKRLRQHYLYAALTQLYKIVGSLELMGNPIGLVSSLGTGVKDFFYEPSSAIIASPTEVGKISKGVLKGTISLVGNTAEGLIGTGTTITRSFGRGVSKLTMDQTFIVAREALHRPARTLSEAGLRPFKDVLNGVYCGIAGVVKVPYSAFLRRPTLSGMIIAIGQGVAGLAAKPAVGVLDALTHTGEALRETVRVITREQIIPVHRVRFSNQFGPDGRILPYIFSTALGTHILDSVDRSASEGVGNVINESRDFVTSIFTQFGTTNRRRRSQTMSGLALKGPSKGSSTGTYSGATTPFADKNMQSGDKFKLKGAQVDIDDFIDDFIQDDANRGTDRLEFVIHAAIIPKSDENLSQLVIVTTYRVLVVDYIKRKRALSSYVTRWQEPIHSLKAPLLERSSVGSITVVLGPVREDEKESMNEKESVEKDSSPNSDRAHAAGDEEDRVERKPIPRKRKEDFVIESNYHEEEVIIELYNVLMIVWSQGKLGVHQLETTAIKDGVERYGDVVTLDDLGVYHIGPWEFKQDTDDHSQKSAGLSQMNLIKTKKLDMAKWYQDGLHIDRHARNGTFGAGSTESLVNMQATESNSDGRLKRKYPKWLQDERQKAMSSHKREHSLHDMEKPSNYNNASPGLSKELINNHEVEPIPVSRNRINSHGSFSSHDGDEPKRSASSLSNLFGILDNSSAPVRRQSGQHENYSPIGSAGSSSPPRSVTIAETVTEIPRRNKKAASSPRSPTIKSAASMHDASLLPPLDLVDNIPDNVSVGSNTTHMSQAQVDALMNRLDSLEALLVKLGIDKKLIDAAGTGVNPGASTAN